MGRPVMPVVRAYRRGCKRAAINSGDCCAKKFGKTPPLAISSLHALTCRRAGTWCRGPQVDNCVDHSAKRRAVRHLLTAVFTSHPAIFGNQIARIGVLQSSQFSDLALSFCFGHGSIVPFRFQNQKKATANIIPLEHTRH